MEISRLFLLKRKPYFYSPGTNEIVKKHGAPHCHGEHQRSQAEGEHRIVSRPVVSYDVA